MQNWPRTRKETPRQGNSNHMFCMFHNDVGHTTDTCIHLRDKIECLIRSSDLKDLTPGPAQRQPGRSITRTVITPQREVQPAGSPTQEKKRNQIHMILGGPAGGDSNRARKLHLRELNELTYEIKELEGMDTGPVLVF